MSRITGIIEDIKEQYLESDNNIPWIIGFSGGKDSTTVLTLVWRALVSVREQLGAAALSREVIVVNNDTLVENPIITDYVLEVLDYIKRAAIVQQLPIKVQITLPKLEDSFWVNFLGKGYPVPNNQFRWCTERLKIKPTSQFILDKVDAMGEAIVLIGTRLSESATRAKSIRKHEIKGHRLTKHPLNPNTFTYAPIKELYLEEVWYILSKEPSPWGYDNEKLFQIYADASSDDYECPTMITDKSQPSCGQSRFGCWVCTVVKEDKSMKALVEHGNSWMAPMLAYRDLMVEGRNVSENRYSTRRNGQAAVDAEGHNMGNYTFEYRKDMLYRLLVLQRDLQKQKPHMELISNQELVAIQINWYRDGFFTPKVTDIYNEVYNRLMPFENMQYQERLILEAVCKDHPEDYQLINDLVSLQKSKTILMNNNGLQGDIERRLDNYINERK
jgi:DNA sulfur modification protein DndC